MFVLTEPSHQLCVSILAVFVFCHANPSRRKELISQDEHTPDRFTCSRFISVTQYFLFYFPYTLIMAPESFFCLAPNKTSDRASHGPSINANRDACRADDEERKKIFPFAHTQVFSFLFESSCFMSKPKIENFSLPSLSGIAARWKIDSFEFD